MFESFFALPPLNPVNEIENNFFCLANLRAFTIFGELPEALITNNISPGL